MTSTRGLEDIGGCCGSDWSSKCGYRLIYGLLGGLGLCVLMVMVPAKSLTLFSSVQQVSLLPIIINVCEREGPGDRSGTPPTRGVAGEGVTRS